MRPMLSTQVDKQVAAGLVNNEEWIVSQKIDGRRALIKIDDGEVTAYGRNGQLFEVGHLMDLSFRTALPNGLWIIDGEIARTDDRHTYFFAFDLPVAGSLISPASPFSERLKALEHVSKIAQWDNHAPLGVLYYARTREEKTDLILRLKANHAEGAIFRRLGAQYLEGVRSIDSLKFKFVLEADCIVMDVGVNGKDNILLGVHKDGELVDVGKCTALAGDGQSVVKGDVVTVRYLYVSEDGRLVQPTYPLIRHDKDPEDCSFLQLVPISRHADLYRPSV